MGSQGLHLLCASFLLLNMQKVGIIYCPPEPELLDLRLHLNTIFSAQNCPSLTRSRLMCIWRTPKFRARKPKVIVGSLHEELFIQSRCEKKGFSLLDQQRTHHLRTSTTIPLPISSFFFVLSYVLMFFCHSPALTPTGFSTSVRRVIYCSQKGYIPTCRDI